MSKKCSTRKKYANGTNANGMDPNNYIISPAEAMNDYNIMLAKAESEALSNPWLPITAMVGGLMQQGIGMAGSFKGGGAAKPTNGAVNPAINTEAINSFDFTKGSQGATLGTGQGAAMGMNSVEEDVEVEGGEMYETPQGEVGEFEGPSHEEGGIPLEVGQDVEQGTKVYSDRLKVGDKTLAERKEAREKRTANLEKAAAQPLIDVATKNALKRKMEAIQKEEMADLQFQEQVNNIQAMADTMVKAFGTGAEGIQKMNNGGIVGEPKYDKFGNPILDIASMLQTPGVIPSNQIDYSTNYQSLPKTDLNAPSVKETPFIDLTDPANNPANYETNRIKNYHDALGITPDTPGYGTAWGDKSNTALFQHDAKRIPNDEQIVRMQKQGKTKYTSTKENLLSKRMPKRNKRLGLTSEGYKYTGGNALLNDESVSTVTEDELLAGTEEGMKNADAESDMAFYKPGQVGTPIVKKEAGKTKSGKFMKALGENTPAIGDMTKLIGNYLGMTAGMKNAAEQRSTDVTHRNTFANAGEESQRLLDNAKKGIEISKVQAIQKATTVGRGGKRGARGSARGVNQMRAMDWLYDTALQSQIADISAKTAEQISGIDIQKSGVAMNADQLKGQGEYQAAMANEAAKDAFYTAMGLGKKDFATGMQQSGADLNAMKQNKILEKLLTQEGEYAGMTAKGDFYGKPAKKKETKTEDEYEVELDAQGNKFITIQGKKVLIKK